MNQVTSNTIAAFISLVRSRSGLTLKGFASAVGSDDCDIADYESGRVMPPADIFVRIQIYYRKLLEHRLHNPIKLP